jgi:hypothetical protein
MAGCEMGGPGFEEEQIIAWLPLASKGLGWAGGSHLEFGVNL